MHLEVVADYDISSDLHHLGLHVALNIIKYMGSSSLFEYLLDGTTILFWV